MQRLSAEMTEAIQPEESFTFLLISVAIYFIKAQCCGNYFQSSFFCFYCLSTSRIKIFLSSSSLCAICQFSDKELFTVGHLLTSTQLSHSPDLFTTAHWPNCSFLKGLLHFWHTRNIIKCKQFSPCQLKIKKIYSLNFQFSQFKK